MNYEKLTKEEVAAIKSLERLANKWPQTLLIFASGGALSIRKINEDGTYFADTEVASVLGIPNDGGDGGDQF